MPQKFDAKTFLLGLLSLAITALGLAAFSVHIWHSSFFFDDAFMFYRYAYNLHHFHAAVWNIGGPHTFGTTSLPWMFVVTAFSYLPFGPAVILPLASSIFFIATLLLLAYFFSTSSKSPVFHNFWRLYLAIAALLMLSTQFLQLATGGMETMLALFVNTLLCMTILDLLHREITYKSIVVLSCISFFAYTVRPETGICDLLIPIFILAIQGKHWKAYAALFSLMTTALMAIELLLCKLYFGSALPLSFYIKSTNVLHADDVNIPAWPLYFHSFLGYACIYLVLIFLIGRKKDVRILAAFFLPVFATFCYLGYVVQISGDSGRYYLPFLPYIAIPAFFLLDNYIDEKNPIPNSEFLSRFLLGSVVILLASASYGVGIFGYLSAMLPKGGGPPAMRSYRANDPVLPTMQWKFALISFSDDVACRLPQGTKIAAGEVGYLSAKCHAVDIIDLSGLNDSHIARKGFSSAYVLRQQPDLIWLPVTLNHTRWRRDILLNPQFQNQYDFVADAFNYGIAIRKDSPHYAQILAVLRRAWPKYYPTTCVAPICEARPTPSLP